MPDKYNLQSDIEFINSLLYTAKTNAATRDNNYGMAIAQLVRAKCAAIHVLESNNVAGVAKDSIAMATSQLGKLIESEMKTPDQTDETTVWKWKDLDGKDDLIDRELPKD